MAQLSREMRNPLRNGRPSEEMDIPSEETDHPFKPRIQTVFASKQCAHAEVKRLLRSRGPPQLLQMYSKKFWISAEQAQTLRQSQVPTAFSRYRRGQL